MRPRMPLLGALLIALLLGACSTPTAQQPTGPLTAITITAADAKGAVGTLGVPFDEAGDPYVDTIHVAIYDDGTRVTFSESDGVYTYDPDGEIDTLVLLFHDTTTIKLPAGRGYLFHTSGYEGPTRIAYGVTLMFINVTTHHVQLVLQTIIDAAALDTRLPINLVTPGQSLDTYLTVASPNGYRVPIADYSVTYAFDGATHATSHIGHRGTVNPAPTLDDFVITATITGWFETIDELAFTALAPTGVGPTDTPQWGSTTATFTKPYALDAFSLDTTRPTLTFTDPTPVHVGVSNTLTGTASDDRAIDRVRLYEGPTLLASTDPGDDVPFITFIGPDTWAFEWTPTTLGTHHLLAIATDTAGNQSEASHDVDVLEAPPTTITFVAGAIGPSIDVGTGEALMLTGDATGVFFSTSHMTLEYLDQNDSTATPVGIAMLGIVVEDGMWRLPWTAPGTPSSYSVTLDYRDSMPPLIYSSWQLLNVQ